MAFDAISPLRATTTGYVMLGPDQVGMSHYVRTDKGSGANAIAISIGDRVYSRLGWTKSDRVLFLEGSGNDAGLARLIKVEEGGYALVVSGGKGSIKLCTRFASSLLRHHVAPTVYKSVTPVEFQAFGGEMLIMLPDWLKPKQG